MLQTVQGIFRDNWMWRTKIWQLAKTELQKEVRGAALGWIWFFITPITYVFVFWFAINIGLRAGKVSGETPFIVWLTVGLIPWFFMRSMLTQGSNVYSRYSYLVNRLRFPVPVISSFFAAGHLIIFFMNFLVVFAVMFVMKVPFTIYALQLPLLVILMYLFWVTWSMMTSPLSAISRDFHNLIKAFSLPLFWLSGIIFNISNLPPTAEWILAFNPITFFATSFRASLCDHYWIWDHPKLIWPFFLVFAVMFVLSVRVQFRLGPEVPDVL
ncbi:MAG: ABC transporter permease [Propionibacteriaceae bacterium]|nr:ABC transporter permease [Propionibacteriaceae bacterium]